MRRTKPPKAKKQARRRAQGRSPSSRTSPPAKQAKVVDISEHLEAVRALRDAPRGKGPKGRRSMLDPERMEIIVQTIAQGGWAYVACRAVGISVCTYHNWMAFGREALSLRDAGKPVPQRLQAYLHFLDAVEVAAAAARIDCEQRVHAVDPRFWLLRGPGRDKGPREPGWSERLEHAGNVGVSLSVEDLVRRAALEDHSEEPTG